MPKKGRGRKAQREERRKRRKVACSMLQLVAGFLWIDLFQPVSIEFLIVPPGSTYFTRVDTVTTGDPHGSSWQVEDAHAAPPHHVSCHRPRFSMQHRPVPYGLCDLS